MSTFVVLSSVNLEEFLKTSKLFSNASQVGVSPGGGRAMLLTLLWNYMYTYDAYKL